MAALEQSQSWTKGQNMSLATSGTIPNLVGTNSKVKGLHLIMFNNWHLNRFLNIN
jgi:hypothetical protein